MTLNYFFSSFFKKLLINEKPISKNHFCYHKKFLVVTLITLIFFNIPINFNQVDATSNNLEIRCIHLYEKFKLLGEEGLRSRYPAKTITNSCLNMYNDPLWNFEGKNLIDKKYPSDLKDNLNSKISSYVKIGPNKFLVNFQICSEVTQSKYLLITTDQEQFIGMILHPNGHLCSSFWSLMYAENPEKTKFSWQFSELSSFHKVRKLM